MLISKIRPKILSCWPWDLLHNIFCDWPIQLYCTYTTMFFSTFILPIIVQPKNINLFFIQTSKWPSIIRIWYFVGSKRVSSSNQNWVCNQENFRCCYWPTLWQMWRTMCNLWLICSPIYFSSNLWRVQLWILSGKNLDFAADSLSTSP